MRGGRYAVTDGALHNGAPAVSSSGAVDKLLRGQARLESVCADIQQRIDKLPDTLGTICAQVVQQSAGIITQASSCESESVAVRNGDMSPGGKKFESTSLVSGPSASAFSMPGFGHASSGGVGAPPTTAPIVSGFSGMITSTTPGNAGALSSCATGGAATSVSTEILLPTVTSVRSVRPRASVSRHSTRYHPEFISGDHSGGVNLAGAADSANGLGPYNPHTNISDAGTVASAARRVTMARAGSGSHVIAPLDVFHDLATTYRMNDYAPVMSMVHECRSGVVNAGTFMHFGNSNPMSLVSINTQPVRGLPLHPMSAPRMIIDALTVLILGLDAIFVPYVLAFDVALEGSVQTIAWAIVSFWTFDLILNFCTGYQLGNSVVMSWKSIVKRYLRRGFTIDFAVLVVDYSDLTRSTSDSSGWQLLKVLRFAKLTRLVRVAVKLRSGLMQRLDAMVSYQLQMYGWTSLLHRINFIVVLIKLLLLIAWLCHIGSCVWYAYEHRAASHIGPSWLEATEAGDGGLGDGVTINYVYGFYWAVSIMFAGASFLIPLNQGEAILSSIWISLGVLFVTSITSILAAMLIDAQEARSGLKKKVRALNTYMEQRKTPPLLAIAVRMDYLAKMSSPALLTEFDIPQLDAVKADLRAHLRLSQYHLKFLKLPFMVVIHEMHDKFLTKLSSISTFTLTRAGDEIFNASDVMERSMVLGRGVLHYTTVRTAQRMTVHLRPVRSNTDVIKSASGQDRSPGRREQDRQEELLAAGANEQSWICAVALFVHWKAVGVLKAAEHCELLHINSQSFADLITHNVATGSVASSYAVLLAEALAADQSSAMPETTDLEIAIDHDCLFSNMHASVREMVSIPLLNKVMRKHHNSLMAFMWRKTLTDLSKEVERGKSHLTMDSGEICRVVRVAVLRLATAEGKLLVKLADYEDGRCTPSFRLPGRKMEGNESPNDCIQRLLANELHEVAPYIERTHLEMVVEMKQSESFGLPTKYIKFIQVALLRAVFESEVEPEYCSTQSRPAAVVKTGSQASSSISLAAMGSYVVNFIHSGRPGPEGNSPVGSTRDFQEPVSSQLESSNQAFAVQYANDLSAEDSFAPSPGAVSLPRLSLCKWMPAEDYDALEDTPEEVNAQLGTWTTRISPERMRQLRKWRLKTAIVQSADLGEEDVMAENLDDASSNLSAGWNEPLDSYNV